MMDESLENKLTGNENGQKDPNTGENVIEDLSEDQILNLLKDISLDFADPANTGIEVVSANMVAFWKWKHEAKQCSICRNLLVNICIKCISDPKSFKSHCTVSWGTCGHSFHTHCIDKWSAQRQCCPLDNQTWVCKMTSQPILVNDDQFMTPFSNNRPPMSD